MTGASPFGVEFQTRKSNESLSQRSMPAVSLCRPEDDVAVGPADYGKVGARFETLAGSHPP